MTKTILNVNIFERAGAFAENKDIARMIRQEEIMPALERNDKIVLNFEHVDLSTQSFIHALISQPIREYGDKALENITFHKCNDVIKKLIKIVFEYMQDGIGGG